MTLSRLVTYFYYDRIPLPKRKGLRRLWGCRHKRTSFPQKPEGKPNYVACLDCGRELSYDWEKMQMGEEI
jgi:hypothetical protein